MEQRRTEHLIPVRSSCQPRVWLSQCPSVPCQVFIGDQEQSDIWKPVSRPCKHAVSLSGQRVNHWEEYKNSDFQSPTCSKGSYREILKYFSSRVTHPSPGPSSSVNWQKFCCNYSRFVLVGIKMLSSLRRRTRWRSCQMMEMITWQWCTVLRVLGSLSFTLITEGLVPADFDPNSLQLELHCLLLNWNWYQMKLNTSNEGLFFHESWDKG